MNVNWTIFVARSAAFSRRVRHYHTNRIAALHAGIPVATHVVMRVRAAKVHIPSRNTGILIPIRMSNRKNMRMTRPRSRILKCPRNRRNPANRKRPAKSLIPGLKIISAP
jgi:hypothetical protein